MTGVCLETLAFFDSKPLEASLGCATPFHRLRHLRLIWHRGPGVGGLKAAQNLVRGVLQPGVGFVELAGCFARQLSELITVGHVRECPKY